MGKFQFCGPSYESQSLSADAQKLMNWYLEQIESGDGNSKFALYPSPGTKTFIKFQPPPPPSPYPSGQFGIQNTLVQLSAAQLKTAFAAPLTLIPAPAAANHAIVPLSAVIQLNFNGTAYTVDANPTIGFGTSSVDVSDNGWMMYPTFGRLLPFMQQAGTTICFTSVTDSGQAAGAFDPTTHIVNQPLVWANGNDISGNAGNSTITINIQWVEVDVTTGIIYNGIGKTIFGSMTQLTRAQMNSNAVIPLVHAPGPGLIIIPFAMQVWFHSTGAGGLFIDLIQLQAPADHFYLTSNIYPLITPAQITNQPLNYAFLTGTSLPFPRQVGYGGATPTDVLNVGVFDFHKGDIEDTNGATVYLQYLVLDPATGKLQQAGAGGGDATYSFTNISGAQLKNALAAPIQLAPAPGAAKISYPFSFIVNSKFNTVAYPPHTPNFPIPSVGTGVTADFIDFQFFMAPNFLNDAKALFTANANQIVLGTPQSDQAVGDCTPAETINAPILWGDDKDLHASAADSSASVAMQFIVIDTVTGNIVSNPPAAVGGNIRGELTIGVVP